MKHNNNELYADQPVMYISVQQTQEGLASIKMLIFEQSLFILKTFLVPWIKFS